MIPKVTLLTFLVYTAASGQEEDSTNRLATLDSSRRFVRWLHPLGSSSIAEAPSAFLNEIRATPDETHYLRGHMDILPVASTYTTLAQHKLEEEDDNETPSRYLKTRKQKNKEKKMKKRNEMRKKRRKNKKRRKKKQGQGLFDKTIQAASDSWAKLQKQLKKQKQQLKKMINKNQNQPEIKSNGGPCAGTSGICAVFNVGTDTSNGGTNGNGGGNNGNSSNKNGYNGYTNGNGNGGTTNGNGFEQETKTLKDIDGDNETTTTTMEPLPTYEWVKLDDRQHRAYDYFGRSVAIDENTIVVGAPSDDALAWQNKGYVSVFYQGASSEWELQQDLPTPEGVAEGDLFGYSVAIHGNIIVAGAPRIGIVQVYTRPEPGEALTKSGSPLQSHKMGNFGESVAVFGNTVIVGAPHENHSGRIKAGSVYVYVRNGNEWDFEEELIADSPSSHDYFGESVAIYHNTIIVGMPGHGSFEKGGAQVFHRDGDFWEYDGAPISTGGTSAGQYGQHCDIHREIVAVGGALAASPKVFEKDFTNAWVPLGYSSLTTGGTAVAIDHDQGNNNDILVVGGYNKVKIFYHEDNQWNENEDVPTETDDVVDGDAFGASVAISEGYVVAGAPMTHAGGLSPVGDVFVMDLIWT